jgi:GAF domain-containing protein
MTVQSEQEAFFSEEDITVLQTVANQVANAVRNARLFQRLNESLTAERRAYGEMNREIWSELLRARPDLSFRSDRRATLPTEGVWRPEMRGALQTGETQVGEDENAVALPIKVRDEVVGVIGGRKPDGTAWTTEEIDLLETLADQLSVALESARLFEDAQRRAAREQLVGEVTGRIRESLKLETILETAAHEIGEALGLVALEVRLDEDEQA